MPTLDPQLVEIVVANSEVEMLLYRTVLQEAGIDVMVKRVGDPVVTGDIYRMQDPHYLLQVRAEEAVHARILITDYRRSIDTGEAQETAATGEEADDPGDAVAPFSSGRWIVPRLLLAVLIIAVILALIAILPQVLNH